MEKKLDDLCFGQDTLWHTQLHCAWSAGQEGTQLWGGCLVHGMYSVSLCCRNSLLSWKHMTPKSLLEDYLLLAVIKKNVDIEIHAYFWLGCICCWLCCVRNCEPELCVSFGNQLVFWTVVELSRRILNVWCILRCEEHLISINYFFYWICTIFLVYDINCPLGQVPKSLSA